MTVSKNISAILLAGGKSSRMGTDKGLILYEGKSFIDHIISAAQPLVKDLIIVSDNPDYDDFSARRVEDHVKDFGPIAGLYSGLRASGNDLNLVLSCDIPGIKSKILKELIKAYDGSSEICMARSDNRDLPLIALYRKNCADSCLKLIENEERRLMKLLELHKVQYVEIPAADRIYVANLNTPEQMINWTHEIDG